MKRAPALFVSHGSPMFAVQPGRLGPRLTELGAGLDGARAILVASPHWQTRGVRVSVSAVPGTIHDFGGFPEALHQLRYPAPGGPAQAHNTAALLTQAGFAVNEVDRGLDHGAWVPLMYLRPAADIAVFQVSMPYDLDAGGALRLGTALRPLREQGIVILGSGSLTHNLSEFFSGAQESGYARQFSAWVRNVISDHNTGALLNYRDLAPHATRAHPTEEHFLPLLVAIGAAHETESGDVLDGGMDGVLSMDSFAWGRVPS